MDLARCGNARRDATPTTNRNENIPLCSGIFMTQFEVTRNQTYHSVLILLELPGKATPPPAPLPQKEAMMAQEFQVSMDTAKNSPSLSAVVSTEKD